MFSENFPKENLKMENARKQEEECASEPFRKIYKAFSQTSAGKHNVALKIFKE